jgi:hypothetical protein
MTCVGNVAPSRASRLASRCHQATPKWYFVPWKARILRLRLTRANVANVERKSNFQADLEANNLPEGKFRFVLDIGNSA